MTKTHAVLYLVAFGILDEFHNSYNTYYMLSYHWVSFTCILVKVVAIKMDSVD